MADHNIAIVIDPSRARSGARAVNRSLNTIRDNTENLNKSLRRTNKLSETFSRRLSSISGLIASFQPFRLFGGFVNQINEADKLFMSFVSQMYTMNESIEKSKQAFQEVTKYAAAYSVPIESLTKGFAKLKASMDFPGLRRNFRDLFESFTMVGQVLHLAPQNMERVYNALIQIMSKGSVTSEELKEQLGEHLPGMISMTAEAIGMSTREMLKMMERGEFEARLFADRVPEYIMDRFSKASIIATKSLQGALNTFRNSWKQAMIEMTDAGASQGIAFLLRTVAKRITETEGAFAALGEQINRAAIQLAYWVAQITPQDVKQFTDSVLALGRGFGWLVMQIASMVVLIQNNHQLFTNIFLGLLGYKAARGISALSSQLMTVVGWLSKLPKFLKVVGGIAGAILTVVGLVYKYRNSLVTVGDTSAKVSSIAKVVWSDITDNVSDAVDRIIAFYQRWWDISAELWESITSHAGSSLETISKYFKALYNGVAATAESIYDVFVIYTSEIPKVFWEAFKGVLAMGPAFAVSLWDSITSLEPDFSALNMAFNQAKNNLTAKSAALGSEMASAVSENFSKDYASHAADVIKGTFESISINIDNYTQSTRDSMREYFDSVMNRAYFEDMEDDVKSLEAMFDHIQIHYDEMTDEQLAGMAELREQLRKYAEDDAALAEDIANGTEEFSNRSGSVADLHAEYRELIGQIDPTIQKFDDLADKEFRLWELSDKLGISYSEMAKYLNMLHTDADETKDKLNGVADEADPFTRAWENALKRLDDAFVDIWRSAFKGFDDFRDSITSAFKDMLAEMAHAAITRPIVLQLGAALGVTPKSELEGNMGIFGDGGIKQLGVVKNLSSAWNTATDAASAFYDAASGAKYGTDFMSQQSRMLAAQDTKFATNAGGGHLMSTAASAFGGYLGMGLGGDSRLGRAAGYTAGALTGTALYGGASAAMAGGSFLSGAGGALAAMGPAGWAALALGAIAAFAGGGKPSHKSAKTSIDFETDSVRRWGLDSTEAEGGYEAFDKQLVGTGKKFSQENRDAVDALSQTVVSMAESLKATFDTGLTSNLAITRSDRTGLSLADLDVEKFYEGETGLDPSEVITKALKHLLAGATEDIPEYAETLLTSITGEVDDIIKTVGAGLDLFVALNAEKSAVGMARSDYEAAQDPQTMTEAYREQRDAVIDLSSVTDWSNQSIQELSAAFLQNQQMAYQMTTAYLQASEVISASLSSLKDRIRQDLMSEEELYNYRRSQAEELAASIRHMTDPGRIAETVARIEEITSSAWQSLSDAQKEVMGEDFMKFLDDTDNLAQSRIDHGLEQLESAQASLSEQVEAAMQNAALSMQSAADKQNTAADKMTSAADRISSAISNIDLNNGGSDTYSPEVTYA